VGQDPIAHGPLAKPLGLAELVQFAQAEDGPGSLASRGVPLPLRRRMSTSIKISGRTEPDKRRGDHGGVHGDSFRLPLGVKGAWDGPNSYILYIFI